MNHESMSIGLESGVVRVVPYDSEWLRLFEQEAALIRAVIGDDILDIQHIGSTSVPDLAAKPIIDIAIAVDDFERAAACVELLVGLGYTYKGENGIPRRHFFVKGDPTTYHIHMNELGSDDWKQQICFRDQLRLDPVVRQAYMDLKQQLAQEYPDDRLAYLDGKAAFIHEVLKLAGCGDFVSA